MSDPDIYAMRAKLMALEVLAVTRGVFPVTYVKRPWWSRILRWRP